MSAALETVAFTCGAGHSGSTLFGLMLGAHPRAFYAGEAKKSLFLGDLTKPKKKRVCKLCGEGCVVWSRVTANDPALHATLASITGKSVVVDSSKDTAWIERSAEAAAKAGATVRLFFLQRDGRAVVASRLRKYPETSARQHAADFVRTIAASRALAARFPGGAHVVRYEELATAPAATLTAACAFLGLTFDAAMLEPWRVKQHPLGGNSGTAWLLSGQERPASTMLGLGERTRGYYEAHPRAIVLDERWRRELGESTVREVEEVLGETNRELAWPSEGSP